MSCKEEGDWDFFLWIGEPAIIGVAAVGALSFIAPNTMGKVIGQPLDGSPRPIGQVLRGLGVAALIGIVGVGLWRAHQTNKALRQYYALPASQRSAMRHMILSPEIADLMDEEIG